MGVIFKLLPFSNMLSTKNVLQFFQKFLLILVLKSEAVVFG